MSRVRRWSLQYFLLHAFLTLYGLLFASRPAFGRCEIAASVRRSTLKKSWLVRDLSDLTGDAARDVDSGRGIWLL
jgi:hypothetical protein